MAGDLIKGRAVNRILVAVIALLCLGCLMDQRLARVQPGMTKSEVMGIIKKRPTGFKNESGSETLIWEDEYYVKFKDGQVVAKGVE
jgi:hypothetical protein